MASRPGSGGPFYPPTAPHHPAASRPLDGFAVAALVFGILLSPLGLVFGLVSMSRIQRSRARGHGLAVAGTVLGSLSIVVLFGFLVSQLSGGQSSHPDNITEEQTIAADAVEPGHCANLADINNAGANVPVVPCADPHDVEILADLGPGNVVDPSAINLKCGAYVHNLTGKAATHLEMAIIPLVPDEAGGRSPTQYLCAVIAVDSTITGSFVVGDAEIT